MYAKGSKHFKAGNGKAAGAAGPSRRNGTRPRRAAAGDTAPRIEPGAIEKFAVGEAVEAAQESKLTALRDILATPPGDAAAVAKSLEAMMVGASPDDVAALRDALLKSLEQVGERLPVSTDDELADDWRDGGYPYHNLMLRWNYENHKYRLQVELLKLQAWHRSWPA